jgi:dihydroorotate dehydrogenase
MNLETRYLGLSLAHPVIASASPLSATFDGIRRLEDAGAAAIVAASIYEEEIEAQTAALDAFGAIGAESNPEVTGYLPPLPDYPGALAAHLELIRRAVDSISVPLIASLNGITRVGWTGIAADLQAAGAAAIELDLFHLPTDPQETLAEVERRLGPGIEGPEEVVKYLLAGADAVLAASALLRHGAAHLRRLVTGLAEWLEAHGASSVGEIRGRMRADRVADADALFRADYRRSLLVDPSAAEAGGRGLVWEPDGSENRATIA